MKVTQPIQKTVADTKLERKLSNSKKKAQQTQPH